MRHEFWAISVSQMPLFEYHGPAIWFSRLQVPETAKLEEWILATVSFLGVFWEWRDFPWGMDSLHSKHTRGSLHDGVRLPRCFAYHLTPKYPENGAFHMWVKSNQNRSWNRGHAVEVINRKSCLRCVKIYTYIPKKMFCGFPIFNDIDK